MYNGNRIKELLVLRNISNKELLNYLGVEYNSSLTQLISGNPSVKKLEKVADFFGVSMDTFFNREIDFDESSGLTNDVKVLKEKIVLLENLIREKDKNIKLLESMNELLSGTKSGQKSE